MSDIEFDDLIAEAGGQAGEAHPETAALLAELERKTKARKLVVPTKDGDVKLKLREMGHPITLFGERQADRRDRLRDLISRLKQRGMDGEGSDASMTSDSEDAASEDDEKEEEFYTEGGSDLLQERKWIAKYSLNRSVPPSVTIYNCLTEPQNRAKQRITQQRKEATIPLGAIMDARKAVFAELKTYTTLGTQLADERPISNVRFSPNSQYLATGSWSGTAKIWDVPGCRCLGVFKGHGVERIGGLAWHPEATLSQSPSAVNFATGAADNKVNLWSIDSLSDPSTSSKGEPEANTKPLQTLSGHSLRVCRVAFHPSGRTLGSASFDETWRLWDVETGSDLLVQEGHSKEVYALAFQSDGALLCSGGMDAIGRVWDLRSGKTAMVLDGHMKDILSIDFAPNGHQIATASNDDTVRIWDMRSLKSIYTIAAHKSTVSDCCFFRSQDGQFPFTLEQKKKPIQHHALTNGGPSAGIDGVKLSEDHMETDRKEQEAGSEAQEIVVPPLNGMYLATSGYDGLVKFWSADDWQLIRGLSSEAGGKVMSVDLSKGEGFFLFFVSRI